MVERPGDLARLPAGAGWSLPLFGDDAEVSACLETDRVALVLAVLADGQLALLCDDGRSGFCWARDVVEAG